MDGCKLYRTAEGIFAERSGARYPLRANDWDELINRPRLATVLRGIIESSRASKAPLPALLPPVQSQEVWAAGVTYLRSKKARMDESKEAGGGNFYDRVYEAKRPELFFKATPHRVVGEGGIVRIRRDSQWTVPEPELGLFINEAGEIAGYTIGNDMSSRDIEGENPLYLPQAKIYDGSCALGPGLLVTQDPLPLTTTIEIEIRREAALVFSGATSLDQIRRPFGELVDFLCRETRFPNGCFLLTGTGIIPPDSFTLQSGDEVAITIAPIGTLTNTVA